MNEVELFKLLADENRLKIFILLLFKELCICDLECYLNLKQANVSKHMIQFKKLDVVEMRKDAQWVYYKMNERFINDNKDLVLYIRNKSLSNPLYSELIKKCSEPNNCLLR